MKIRLKNIVTASLLMSAVAVYGYDASYYADRSALSEGRWVKIRVDRNGLYKIDRETLAEWGFDDPSRVTVYGYGGSRLYTETFDADLPDDVRPTATMRRDDGIIFYGEGVLTSRSRSLSSLDISRNIYDRYGYYFITEDGGGTPCGSVRAGVVQSNASDHHMSAVVIENDIVNPGNGGGVFHDTPMNPGERRVYSFEITDFHITSALPPYGIFKYNFGAHNEDGNTKLAIDFPETFKEKFRREGSAQTIRGETRYYNSAEGYIQVEAASADALVGRSETVGFGLTLDESTDADYVAVDRTSFCYPRLNRLGDRDFLELRYAQTITFAISESDADVYVWDISDVAAVKPLDVVYDASSAKTMVRNSGSTPAVMKYMAFRASGDFMKPEYAGEVRTSNLHGMPTPEMVIITTGDFVGQARELAAIHGRHGLDVAVVEQADIFNEFSSGTRSAMGYKRFIKMLYDRGAGRLKHVLLYGPSHWDNRDGVAGGLESLIAYETDLESCAYDASSNYTADTYFVKLSDSYNNARQYYETMDVNIGRIPVYSTGVASAVNRKIERHLTSTDRALAYGTAIMMSDDGDDNAHLNQSLELIESMKALNSSIGFVQIHNLIYPWEKKSAVAARATMTSALRRGAGYVTFAGHSRSHDLTGENLWSMSDVEKTRYDVSPMAMLATCSTFDFDRRTKTLADAFFDEEHGGMIGVVTSCREVFMNYNQPFNIKMAECYASAEAGMTVGDLFRTAYNATISNAGFGLAVNTMCYNLCGDPAVPLAAHNRSIKLDDVCGGASELTAPGTLTLTGSVVDGDAVDEDFDGEIYVTVYDGPKTLYTVIKDNDKGENNLPVEHDEYILASARGRVSGGHFDMSLSLPYPQRPGVSNRIVVTAVSDNGLSATTVYNGLTITASAEHIPGTTDPTAPEITALYIDNSDFANGDVVSGDFTVYGEIMASASGLDVRTEGIGGGVSLILDGKRRLDGLTETLDIVEAGKPTTFSLDVSEVTDGRHTLTLTAFNNDGVKSSRSIDFIVVNEPLAATLEVYEREADEEAELTLAYDSSRQPTVRLVIEDIAGHPVKSVDNAVMPYRWSLDDNDGAKVAPGVYRARCYLNVDGRFGVSDSAEIVVLD